jgi:uncharacterized membrane protein YqgA involved in biofilm formation
MILLGTLVNVGTVLLGATIGSTVKTKLDKKYVEIIFSALGLFTIFLGIKMGLAVEKIPVLVFSLLLGGVTGSFFKLEFRVNQWAEKLKKLSGGKQKDSRFAEGLVTAFILFCVGSLTILGALEEGLNNNSELLITKSIMDGVSSIALAAALGRGVIFSVIPLLFYQGGLTVLAKYLKPFIADGSINAMSAVGGVLLIGLGLQLLNIKKFELINLLPALVFAVALSFWI